MVKTTVFFTCDQLFRALIRPVEMKKNLGGGAGSLLKYVGQVR